VSASITRKARTPHGQEPRHKPAMTGPLLSVSSDEAGSFKGYKARQGVPISARQTSADGLAVPLGETDAGMHQRRSPRRGRAGPKRSGPWPAGYWRYEKTGLSQANEGVVSRSPRRAWFSGDDVRPSVNQALRLDGRAFRSMNRTTATASVSHRQQRSHRFRTLRQSHASRSLPAPSRNVHASGHRMTMSRKLDK